MKYIIGAYATAPSLGLNDQRIEKEYYQNLIKFVPAVRGFEIPFWGNDIHIYGTEFLLNFINSEWQNVLTCIPGTVMGLKSDLHFGLASDNEDGRIAAINMHKKAHQKLKEINRVFNKNVFIAVQIATSPSVSISGVSSSISSLMRSLVEILSWNWMGAKIVIEHCDAFTGDLSFEKGFMNLNDEIEVLQFFSKNHDVGMTINWARSAIEGKSAETVIEHIKKVKKSRLLTGMMFSGTTDINAEYGAWKDTHMPIAQEGMAWSNSLLTEKKIGETMLNISLDQIDYVGIKLSLMPFASKSIDTRVNINKNGVL